MADIWIDILASSDNKKSRRKRITDLNNNSGAQSLQQAASASSVVRLLKLARLEAWFTGRVGGYDCLELGFCQWIQVLLRHGQWVLPDYRS